MERKPIFKALSRPVTFIGLPMNYIVLLVGVALGGFIATSSFVYLICSVVLGFVFLRTIAAFEPRILDLVFTTIRETPTPVSWYRGKAIKYHV